MTSRLFNPVPRLARKAGWLRNLLTAGLFIGFVCADEAYGQVSAFRDPNVSNFVIDLAIQPDGKIVICGNFTSVGGQARKSVARLNPDGTLDVSFANSDPNDTIRSLALQPDGKILIGGSFNVFGGTVVRSRVARLNPNGTLDTSFQDTAIGAGSNVGAISVLPDGKILIGGDFSAVSGQPRNSIARLNADGSLDTTYQVLIGGSPVINAILPQPDHKILIGGGFSTVSGQPRKGVARLHSDGGLDTSFQDADASPYVTDMALQPDGRIIIAGQLTTSGRSG